MHVICCDKFNLKHINLLYKEELKCTNICNLHVKFTSQDLIAKKNIIDKDKLLNNNIMTDSV